MATQNINPPINSSSGDAVNGRTSTIPAIPMNGSFSSDHRRTPSMTVTPAGTTVNAPTPTGNKANVQFGSLNNGGNPASSPAVTPSQNAHNTSSSLGVNNFGAHMSNSPSPSPIPQPVQLTGGRPPSSMEGGQPNMRFGNFNTESPDVNGMTRSLSNAHIDHGRRPSQQNSGQDQNMQSGHGGRGGYSGRGGRGSFNGSYNNHSQFNPQNSNFRPSHNSRGGYQGRGGHGPYPNSPSMQHRQPMMQPNSPGMGNLNMAPHMQYGGYQQYPVNGPFPSESAVRGAPDAVRGKSRGSGSMRGKGRKNRGSQANGKPQPTPTTAVPQGYSGPLFYDPATQQTMAPLLVHFAPPDLSPESGNFEQYRNMMLTDTQAAYGQIPIAADPSISYNAQFQQGFYQPGYQQGPPASPRPYFQQSYGGQNMQQQYSNQGPQSMSRQSSQMSAMERPPSSIGQTPQTPAAALHHPSQRAPSVSGKENFNVPTKKSAAIVIKNANGEIVDFGKNKKDNATTPATSSAVPAVPTPPSRTGSAVSTAHNRTESQSVKPEQDQEQKKKAMQEAVARKIAEAKEAEDKKKQAQEDEKAQQEAEAKAAADREAAEKLEQEAKAAKEAEEKTKAEEEAKSAAKDSEKPALTEEEEMELMIAEAERAALEEEAEEARREEEYAKKKAAKQEAERKAKEAEEAEYEATMKEAERKAEEEELAREKKRAEGTSDDEAKKMFANLKGDAADSNDESGTATPMSEVSMPPPAKNAGANRKAKPDQLTLDTKKSTEPPEPSATLKSLNSARRLEDPASVAYPDGIVSPNPALNANAPADRKFKYNKEFLLQFQDVFKEKPSLDWDQKIREALGHDDSARPSTARTPSGMMSRNPSNRPMAGGFNMGQFNGGPQRPIGPGSTSKERFEASTAALHAGRGNPFSMGRPGSMGPAMGRTPSNAPMGLPGSPRVGGASRGGSRAESKRNKHSAKQEAESNKAMPLTAGMNVGSLETSATGWKPRSVGVTANQNASAVGLDGYMEADVVQRKVKAALNKMTPEKFDRISDQILEISAQSKQETDGRTLRQVIQLVFEKATDEAHWAGMYANFCFKMLSTMSPDIKDESIKDKNGNVVTGGNLFRKYLLNRCQEEFEKGWKVNLPPKAEGESEEAAMLSDEYYIAMAAKRRGLGLVKFIGELFKLNMLTERIMHECVKKLLDYEGVPDEAEVESLSSLLRTIGKQLDSAESKAAGRMDLYFDRIKQTMDLPELPSRLKFMLLDIIDLRKANWVTKDADKGPKTIQQIHEEAEAAKAKDEMQRLASQANSRGGGRMAMGRGDVRSLSYNQMPPPDNSNRVATDDLRRLGNRNRTSTPSGQFGPSGLGARTNSGRKGLGPALRDDSANTSRTGTPPASAKKDESSNNVFSALAALGGEEGPTSPPSNPASPPVQKSTPLERERSQSSDTKEGA